MPAFYSGHYPEKESELISFSGMQSRPQIVINPYNIHTLLTDCENLPRTIH